jgi:predicted permease
MLNDVRFAIRSMARTPVLAAAAIVTLALGIGATTAIFSLIEAVLLRTLPLTSPQELFFVAHGSADDFDRSSNYRWLERVRQRTDVFAGVTAYSHQIFKVSNDAGLERVFGQYVSGNYHALLGVPLAQGRGFAAEDDRVPGGSPIAVISDGYWARRFGRSSSVLGQTLIVGGHPVTIVGITAPGFAGLAPGDSVDITLPLSMRLIDEPDFLTWTDGWTGMPLVARLREGIGVAAASQAIAAAYREYMAEPFNVDFRRGPDGQPRTATLLPAARGDDDLRNEYRVSLRLLMGMVAIVLLVVCVNVANLLIVRAAARSREVAVRAAVGADRLNLLRPFIAESLVLSLTGGAIGLLLAGWGLEFIARLFRGGIEPIVIDVQPDAIVLLFALLVSVVTALAFGIGPGFAALRVDPAPALKGYARSAHASWRGRELLVAAQVALSLMLVFGAALLVRTLQNLRSVDGGFARNGVIVFALDARDTRLPRERLAPLCAEIIAQLDARPDVTSGTCSTMSPVDTHSTRRAITIDGRPRPDQPPTVYTNAIDAGYFETLGLPIVRGRGLLPQDGAASPAVAVIGETMARRYFGDTNPVGRTLRWGWREPGPPIAIVGVARDARLTLRDAPPEMVYTPIAQLVEPPDDLLAAIRTAGDTGTLSDAIRERVRAVSPEIALTYLRSMDDQIDAALVSERLLATLSSTFALLALLLAAVGLYGVLSYDVSRRTRDIGVRLALGADRTRVFSAVLLRTAAIVAIGIAAGLLGAAFASSVVARLVFGLEPRDPLTLAVAASVLALTAMLAGYLPARRASRVDPVTTLRAE